MSTQNLLVELFVEELPPKALKKLGDAFAEEIWLKLADYSLVDTGQIVEYGKTFKVFASPRRLAVWVSEVLGQAPDKPVSQKLMPVSVGLDANGQATPVLLKRLAALGADESAVSKLRREGEGKNGALFYDSIAPGITLADGLQTALETAMARLPIPRVMTYQLADGWSSVNFVRPVHGVVALHGADIVPISVLGLVAGRATQGHRFEARVSPVVIQSADSYAVQLKNEGAVIASFAERRAEIVRQLQTAAAPSGLKPIEDDALLDEVTALVERPNVLIGQFEVAFLEVPQECLILTMKANQKYFPLLDAAGKLTNRFLIVSNISPDDASAVIQGNERVVRPRLADAKFFYDQDRKKALDSRVLGLAKVVYHNKLGTQGERVTRVQAIARAIGERIGGEALGLKSDQAALLAKADLLTDMVGEFPELQGIMGRYYALHDGLADDIAFAIEDHYKPRFSGDALPRSDVGVCVAIADKLEAIVGMFSILGPPTGDKDPYALRRHAAGIVRILSEKKLPLKIDELIGMAYDLIERDWRKGEFLDRDDAIEDIEEFLINRFAGIAREQGYSTNEIDAVVALRPVVFATVQERLSAVRFFTSLPEATALAAANKRVGNILKKAEGAVGESADPARFVEEAEKALFAALGEIAPQADAAFAAGDYTGSLQALAALKAPVDAFFDSVMVNADDPALKVNRLALLNQLHQTMNRVADISRLAA